MKTLRVPIDEPNRNQLTDDAALLRMWEDVHTLLSKQSAVFVVAQDPNEWFGVSVDASHVVRSLRGEIEPSIPTSGIERGQLRDRLMLELHITCSGAAVSYEQFPTDRFVEQLFLACNVAEPGSCAFTYPESSVPLDPALIESACRVGRIPSDDSVDADLWPRWEPVSFKEAWEWLHEDLTYDIEVAETPSQIAIFTMVLLASRSPLDPDNLLASARAIEALFGQGTREGIVKTVERRIEETFGRSEQYPRWFREFYDKRSRLVHGDKKLLRPGVTHPKTPEAFEFLEEHLGPLEHAVRLIMASLSSMIRSRSRDLHG